MKSLQSFVEKHRLLLLTGAGCSTKSGIPDYRGATTGRAPRSPIQHMAFMHSAQVRKRYWARSCLGWPRFAAANPNDAHRACADLERMGRAVGLVSQNVDGLHQAAGSRSVVELHGSLAKVRCFACPITISRAQLQRNLVRDNPSWLQLVAATAPDGDVDLPEQLVDAFVAPRCECGADLMPNVVFFGGNVNPDVLQSAWSLFDQAEGLLVVGSSLTVFSGFRFVKRAAEQGMPIAILNQGPTRGDDLASLRIDADAGETLRDVARGLFQ